MRIALALQYDGQHFYGWQSQPNHPTVQDTLEAAINKIAKTNNDSSRADDTNFIRAHAAGRTDSGVHATAQIAHFDTETNHTMDKWQRALNGNLPQTLRVQWAAKVSDNFHARYSAVQRHYTYYLDNNEVLSPFRFHRVGHYRAPLNLAAMQAAAPALIGEHDFSAFRAAGCRAQTPVRNLKKLDISEHQKLFTIHVTANGFLYHMVRNLTAALIAVGQQKQPPEWLAELLASKDRRHCPETARPDGLYFTGVDYPKQFPLPPTIHAPHIANNSLR